MALQIIRVPRILEPTTTELTFEQTSPGMVNQLTFNLTGMIGDEEPTGVCELSYHLVGAHKDNIVSSGQQINLAEIKTGLTSINISGVFDQIILTSFSGLNLVSASKVNLIMTMAAVN